MFFRILMGQGARTANLKQPTVSLDIVHKNRNASLAGIVIFVCVAEHEALAGGIATTCVHNMSGHTFYNFVLHVYANANVMTCASVDKVGMHHRFVMFGSNALHFKLFCHGTLG